MRSRHSRRTVPAQRSACARFRRPHRRLDHPDALGAKDLVELARELPVSITNQNPGSICTVVTEVQQVARLLGDPAAVLEEVALEDARRLRAQELRPTQLLAPRRRLDLLLLQDRPDRARGQLDPQPDQLALSAPIPPTRFSLAKRSTSERMPAAVAGSPGPRCAYVQRRATSSRCQRSTVAGVTNNDRRHACRGSTPLKAANTARSPGLSAGRATCRLSTRS